MAGPVLGERVIILGCSGSGKSTLAATLHEVTGLPLIHLDNIWWKPDRTHISRDEFDLKLQEILQKKEWIIDGDYSRTYGPRIACCDTVIFLDYSEEVCMQGITGRVGKHRDDIPWSEDTLDPYLVQQVQSYREENRPVILSLMEKYPDRQLLVFRTREETEEWLKGFAAGGILLRPLREGETALIKDLLYEAIFVPEGADPPDRSILELPELQVYWEDLGSRESDCCVVAEAGGEAAGAAWSRIMPDYGHLDDDTPSIAIALFRQYRGKGTGTALMTELMRQIKEKGYGRVSLSVQKENRAVHFYEALGFRTEEERGTELIMVKDLV